INPLQADTLVTILNTTAAGPLVFVATYLYPGSRVDFHTQVAFGDKKKSGEEQVKNEFSFNKLWRKLNQMKVVNMRSVFQFEFKKAYGEWEISEVFEKFLHKEWIIRKFTQPDPEISDDIVNSFINELKRKKKTFIHINHNKSTCREFISAFMTAAVEHAQLKESKLCLKSEEWLDGSHGFGPVDYSVHLEEFVLLVCEPKKEDFEKDETDMEPEPQVQIYSIVTNALGWYFLKWIGSPENSQLEDLDLNFESQETAKSTEGSVISTKSLPPFERASKTHSAAQPTDLNKRIIQTTANTTPNTAPRKRPKKLPKIDKINGVPIPPIIASIPKTT
ncbi:15897_t:CDS:2, partial [Entrophospora sp. SA101]